MYKLILIDLDGTLLNSFGIVTERTKEVIKKTINKGIDVVITSGRSVTEYMKYISKEVGCKNYFIAGNGALIYDIKNNQALYKNYMSKEKVIEIAKICEENNIFYNVYTEDSIITKNPLSRLRMLTTIKRATAETLQRISMQAKKTSQKTVLTSRKIQNSRRAI